MNTRKLAIVGAGGHGKVIADIAVQVGYRDIAFFDDDASIRECGRFPVLGKSSEAGQYGGDVIVAIGNAALRQKIQEGMALCEGKGIATLIHPRAVVAEDVKIGPGSVVMAGAVINPGSVIGKGCIINTCASVDHDCTIGDYVHISVDAHLAGNVSVEARTWVGIGAAVSNNITITHDCMIGAGAVVIRDIGEAGTYVGVPARRLPEE